MICLAVVMPIHFTLSHLFVYKLNLDLVGIGLAGFISHGCALIALSCYNPYTLTVDKLKTAEDTEIFNRDGWKKCWTYSASSLALFQLQYLNFGVMIILSSYLNSKQEIQLQSELYLIASFMLMAAHGFQQGISTIVG